VRTTYDPESVLGRPIGLYLYGTAPITANNSDKNVASAGDSRKMPALPNPSNNSESNVRNAAHCCNIVVLEDDVVPFRSVQPETPCLASASLSSSQIDNICSATLGMGARIEVYCWSLPACKFDVYSYKLMIGPNMYWTHKPTMWIDLVCLDIKKTLLQSSDSMSLHKAMDNCHAAAIHATPGGPNTQHSHNLDTKDEENISTFAVWACAKGKA
jgi:hypothetical protein